MFVLLVGEFSGTLLKGSMKFLSDMVHYKPRLKICTGRYPRADNRTTSTTQSLVDPRDLINKISNNFSSEMFTQKKIVKMQLENYFLGIRCTIFNSKHQNNYKMNIWIRYLARILNLARSHFVKDVKIISSKKNPGKRIDQSVFLMNY